MKYKHGELVEWYSQVKTGVTGENLFLLQYFHDKSHMDWASI
jgi:hypothetical protein